MTRRSEQLVISSVVKAEGWHICLAEGVHPDWFTVYRQEWEWLSDHLAQYKSPPSEDLFESEFPDLELRRVRPEETSAVVSKLREEHLDRKMALILKRYASARKNGKQPSDAMARAKDELTESLLGSVSSGNQSSVFNDIDEAIEEFREEQHRIAARGSAGMPTGITTLDDVTSGPKPGEYWIVAGRLGQGKTWTLLRMATQAVKSKGKTLYHSMEQSRSQMRFRAQLLLADDIQRENLSSLEEVRLRRALKWLKRNVPGELVIDDTGRGRVSPSYVAAQIERHQPDIVFLDYLTLMSKAAGDWMAIAALSSEIKGLAMHYGVPIVAAAQVNRKGADDEGGIMPTSLNLSGSDAIGQDADAVVTLQSVSQRLIRMRLDKYRHAEDGQQWYCEFEPSKGVFCEVGQDRADEVRNEDRGLV